MGYACPIVVETGTDAGAACPPAVPGFGTTCQVPASERCAYPIGAICTNTFAQCIDGAWTIFGDNVACAPASDGGAPAAGPVDGGDAGDAGDGGMPTSNEGTCALTGASTPLAYTLLSSTTRDALSGPTSLNGVVTGMVTYGEDAWTDVVTSQAEYQWFLDQGFPAVDFTTSTVLATGVEYGCNPDDPSPVDVTVTSVGGVPHLDATYAPDVVPGVPGCACDFISGWSVAVVEIASGGPTPTLCIRWQQAGDCHN
jgi:hypothetical protein